MRWLVTKTMNVDSLRRYLEWIGRAGIAGDIIGPSDRLPRDLRPFSALLLTGGGDVDPALYREERHPCARLVDRKRDTMELALVRGFLRARKPVFGVCRGIQVINVALGGKLIQHIPDILATHRCKQAKEEHRALKHKDSRHAVWFPVQSALNKALRNVRQVNSSHHQAVDPKALGKGLRVLALSKGGVIEAIEGVELGAPLLAVQWHPERLAPDHPASRDLLRLLAGMCC